MRLLLFLSLAVFSLAGSCCFSAKARAGLASFVADAVQVEPGKNVRRGRLYVSERGTRFEFTQNGQKVIQIVQPSRGLFRLLFPATKTYFEVKYTPRAAFGKHGTKVPCVPMKGFFCRRTGQIKTGRAVLEQWLIGTKKKRAITALWDPSRHMFVQKIYPDGSKMVALMNGVINFEGRRVERWKTTVTMISGLRQNSYMLFAPDLGYPVVEQRDFGSRRELHNIKNHKADAHLYAIPADYRKAELPPKNTK